VTLEPPVLAAAVLAAGGAGVVIVGSAGLRLHGVDTVVADLDVVPDPTADGLSRLRRALDGLVPLDRWPDVRSLPPIIRVHTSFGPVDVLVERGRTEYAILLAHASTIDLLGVDVTVASVDDIGELRRRFKEETHG
jgi:hypothetical protein